MSEYAAYNAPNLSWDHHIYTYVPKLCYLKRNRFRKESRHRKKSMSGTLEQFLNDLSRGLDKTMVSVNKDLTLRSRVKRKWSMKQCARFLDVSIPYMTKFAKNTQGFPEGEYVGRERVFTLEDLMRMRALLAAAAKRPKDYLVWRDADEPLPVISFASQKGGTAKSLTAAHFAQYLSLHYGMRVGVMDADPQSTITLYFVGGEGLAHIPDEQTATLVDFSGLYMSPDEEPYTDHDAATLDSFFLKTSWPGVRIVPASGDTSEGELQITRLIRDNPPGKAFYRFLRDSIDKWKVAHPPVTRPEALARNGVVDEALLQSALVETLDCIVIDYQPALTLFQLNNVIASTSLVIPQTMKGFDIATLSTFVTGLKGMISHILDHDRIEIGTGANMLLPTIVQRTNDQDLKQIANLLEHAPGEIMPVFYLRSDSIANASDVYQSAYEYEPDTRGKRKGIERFLSNADAVNDAIVERIWPGRSKGFAENWLDEFYADDGEEEA